MKLFIDTSALAGLYQREDSYHAQAVEFMSQARGSALHTSNLIFAETATLLAARHGQDASIRFCEDFLASRRLVVHYADEALERAALAVLKRFRDKRLSFADAATIALVKSEGLDGVFGFDEDFERCGLALYPQAE